MAVSLGMMLLGMQAGGTLLDFFGNQQQKEFGRLGERVNQSQIEGTTADGKIGNVPFSELDQALKEGFKIKDPTQLAALQLLPSFPELLVKHKFPGRSPFQLNLGDLGLSFGGQ